MTTRRPPRSQQRRIRIARIGRAHGVRGEVRVFTDDPASETLARLERLLVEHPEGQFREHRIVRAKLAQRFWIVSLAGVEGREAAEALTGARCWVERAWLPATADADELYACDLIGLTVLDPAGTALGRVVDVFDNGAHDVLVYRAEPSHEGGEAPRQHMIPFHDAFVPAIDLEGGTITVEPLEFLDDDDAAPEPRAGGRHGRTR